MIANTRRNVVLPAIAAVLMIASSASAQSTYFKYELCSADKYVPASGVAIDRNFYKKYVNAGLMPVLSSSKVPDAGLVEMANWIRIMSSNLPAGVKEKISSYNLRSVPMHETEQSLDVPEHSTFSPGFDTSRRDLIVDDSRPAAIAGVENILNYGPGRDPNHGQCNWIYSFGRAIFKMGVDRVNLSSPSLRDRYWNAAQGKDQFNPSDYEYWGLGSMAWFSCSTNNPLGANTRDEIKKVDPKLAELLAEVYGDNAPLYRKPDVKLLEQSIVPCGSGLADVDGDGQNDVSAASPMMAFSTVVSAFSAMAAMLAM